jgi:hypothetical protein
MAQAVFGRLAPAARTDIGAGALERGIHAAFIERGPPRIEELVFADVSAISCGELLDSHRAAHQRFHCADCVKRVASAIQRSTFASSSASGSVPSPSTTSWNFGRLNFGPSAAAARARSSAILSDPIL